MSTESPVSILLVDDHPENLLALEAVLGNLGENLVKAHSGEEALRCLLHQDFAVILLDVQMPGMDGFEAATLIRSRERSRYTPIIFLTAFSTSENLVFKGYSLGAVDYLFKPIEADILISKVKVFVDLFKKTEEVKRQAAQLKAINAELKESEERFRLLSACSPLGIFLTNTEGSCTYANPCCQSICGLTPATSMGEGWLQAVHAEDYAQTKADWLAQTHAAQPYSNEMRLQLPDQVKWVHVRSSPMHSETGQLLGHVGTIEDITERKQAESVRAQVIHEQAARQEAESANRMKDEFLAILSHELRTPLNSMLGWAKLLRTRKFDEATTERALETIERNAKSQEQLIEDILDVSLIIQGKLRLNTCSINPISVIEAALNAVRPLAEDKSIQLESDLDASVGSISGDPDRLQQVVWNLLTNAIKFTGENGVVTVSLCREDNYAKIQVRDNGIGIHAEFLPYVFERFRQADSTTTRSHSGLGLGLAIVSHLVKLLGGKIRAESPGVNQGATFTILLPLLNAKPEQNGTQQAALLSTDLTGVRVLVVDDEADTRDFLVFLLEQYGAIASAVGTVTDAMSAVQTSPPDVLVSDLGMPNEDGYGLIQRITKLKEEQGLTLPTIALTAYSREEDRRKVLESGFNLYISKPVEPLKLVTAVAKLTRQEQASQRQ